MSGFLRVHISGCGGNNCERDSQQTSDWKGSEGGAWAVAVAFPEMRRLMAEDPHKKPSAAPYLPKMADRSQHLERFSEQKHPKCGDSD